MRRKWTESQRAQTSVTEPRSCVSAGSSQRPALGCASARASAARRAPPPRSRGATRRRSRSRSAPTATAAARRRPQAVARVVDRRPRRPDHRREMPRRFTPSEANDGARGDPPARRGDRRAPARAARAAVRARPTRAAHRRQRRRDRPGRARRARRGRAARARRDRATRERDARARRDHQGPRQGLVDFPALCTARKSALLATRRGAGRTTGTGWKQGSQDAGRLDPE